MSKNEILFTDKIKKEITLLDSFCEKQIDCNKTMTNYLTPMFEIPRVTVTILLVFIFYYF